MTKDQQRRHLRQIWTSLLALVKLSLKSLVVFFKTKVGYAVLAGFLVITALCSEPVRRELYKLSQQGLNGFSPNFGDGGNDKIGLTILSPDAAGLRTGRVESSQTVRVKLAGFYSISTKSVSFRVIDPEPIYPQVEYVSFGEYLLTFPSGLSPAIHKLVAVLDDEYIARCDLPIQATSDGGRAHAAALSKPFSSVDESLRKLTRGTIIYAPGASFFDSFFKPEERKILPAMVLRLALTQDSEFVACLAGYRFHLNMRSQSLTVWAGNQMLKRLDTIEMTPRRFRGILDDVHLVFAIEAPRKLDAPAQVYAGIYFATGELKKLGRFQEPSDTKFIPANTNYLVVKSGDVTLKRLGLMSYPTEAATSSAD